MAGRQGRAAQVKVCQRASERVCVQSGSHCFVRPHRAERGSVCLLAGSIASPEQKKEGHNSSRQTNIESCAWVKRAHNTHNTIDQSQASPHKLLQARCAFFPCRLHTHTKVGSIFSLFASSSPFFSLLLLLLLLLFSFACVQFQLFSSFFSLSSVVVVVVGKCVYCDVGVCVASFA